MSNAQPRRIEEGPYFEEDYQEEIMAYMHEMDVSGSRGLRALRRLS
jgi:hypothetical protein